MFFLGFSVGGFAALRLAADSGASGVLAMKPPVDLSSLKGGRGASLDFPKLAPVRSDIDNAIVVYDEHEKRKAHDPNQAVFFEGIAGATVLLLPFFEMKNLLSTGELRAWLASIVR